MEAQHFGEHGEENVGFANTNVPDVCLSMKFRVDTNYGKLFTELDLRPSLQLPPPPLKGEIRGHGENNKRGKKQTTNLTRLVTPEGSADFVIQ